MKRIIKKSMGVLLTKTLPVIAVAAAFSLPFTDIGQAGIEATKHNLGSSGTGSNFTSGTGEICVFCHTPHGSDTSAAVPLWNRTLANPASYTTYDALGTTSLDADVLSVGSVSLACLSCHDGTQAMDNMINAPGSGTGDVSAWTWTGTDTLSSGITSIGTDLRDDHPIGVRYAGADGATLTAVDADFFDAAKGTKNSQTVWWVDTSGGTAGTRESTDLILYTRDNTGNGGAAEEPFVECASCHDPHTENTTFLRIANTGSAVCKTCHNK